MGPHEFVDGEETPTRGDGGQDDGTEALVETTEEGEVSVAGALEAGFDCVQRVD